MKYTYPDVSVWSRHGLPHWQALGGLYFITWRLADSISRGDQLQLKNTQDALARLRREGAPLASVAAAEREHFRLLERGLDRGYGAAFLKEPAIADLVESALRFADGDTYELISHAVMPNHVHVVFRLHGQVDHVVQRWKSYTAHEANRILGRSGAFWSDDYFDVLIRDTEQFEKTVTYVRMNPVKAELVNWRWVGFDATRYASCL